MNGCILLTNKNSRDPVSIDHNNILIALAMKKYAKELTGEQNLPLCL